MKDGDGKIRKERNAARNFGIQHLQVMGMVNYKVPCTTGVEKEKQKIYRRSSFRRTFEWLGYVVAAMTFPRARNVRSCNSDPTNQRVLQSTIFLARVASAATEPR